MKIKEISLENRPRERLKNFGPEALSEAELLAIILRTGSYSESVLDISNKLIAKHGIEALSKCSVKVLQKEKGIGFAKACQIVAAFELGKRHKISKNKTCQFKSSKDIFNYCSPKMSNLDKEHLVALHLDTKNRIVKEEVVSIGTLNSSLIHPREVFKTAVHESSNSIILVHNHPSGDPTPSAEDLTVTKQLAKAGEIMGITLLDHVIIGKVKWWSWKENS